MKTGSLVSARRMPWMIWPARRRCRVRRWPADFGFVVHAAQGNANELAAQARAMDLPKEVLPTPGGPTKQRMGPLRSRFKLKDGQIFEHALLDFFQVVVVFIQDLLGALDVHLLRARLRPRQGRQPF